MDWKNHLGSLGALSLAGLILLFGAVLNDWELAAEDKVLATVVVIWAAILFKRERDG